MQSIRVPAVTALTAHREWASRPADERFATVSALHDAARARRDRTEERDVESSRLRTEAISSSRRFTMTRSTTLEPPPA